MNRTLPKHILCSRRFGKYKHENYITWNLLEVLAVLSNVNEDSPAWTAPRLASEIDMNSQSMQRMLGRLKNKGLVEWGKDINGRKAWIITQNGLDFLFQKMHFKLSFRVPNKARFFELVRSIITRAREVHTTLKAIGWKDTQTRDLMLRTDLGRIEWAIATTRKRNVENPGAYINKLLKYGQDNFARAKAYVEASAGNFNKDTREEIVNCAAESENMFDAAVEITRKMWSVVGGNHPKMVSPDAARKLYRVLTATKKIKPRVRRSAVAV